MLHIMGGVTAILLWMVWAQPLGAAQKPDAAANEAGQFVLRYAEALAGSQVERWAAADLGCLGRQKRSHGEAGGTSRARAAQNCWDETLNAHAAMVAQEAETGVFQAVGRGAGLGLIHDRHRATDMWKEYPPAVFVSPAVVRRDEAPAPQLTIVRTGPTTAIALTGLAGTEPVGVRARAVDLKIVYQDPLTAPLALKADEVWWASGIQRRFGPVREVAVRFILVTGLRSFGYAADQAVLNEALPSAPRIPTTQYGYRPDAGRRIEGDGAGSGGGILKGELLMGSPRWWERADAQDWFREAVARAAHLPVAERGRLLTRLLLLDPADGPVHALRGADAYHAFLKQGIAKGALAAREEPALRRLAELYWTLQAQTWRQELTAVAEGYEPSAETLYQALASYEQLNGQNLAGPEERRKLGALSRWNNDPKSAVEIHERLLNETDRDDPFHAVVLSELAWDRLQWVSWERRYDHPWLAQAAVEAARAAERAEQPHERLYAEYALVVAESLMVPRDPGRFNQRLQLVRQELDRIPGVKGILGHLLANDLVKGLVADSATVVLPLPPRSAEVLDVAVHATPPRQDIVWSWNFDRDAPNAVPRGFTALTSVGAEAPEWRVLVDQEAPTPGQSVAQSRTCSVPDCADLLLAEEVRTTYPDVTIQFKDMSPDGQGEAGIAVAVRDLNNYYSVTVRPSAGLLTTRRVTEGVATMLGQVPVKLAPRAWHTLRVQRINFLHLDKGRLAVFLDGAQVAAVDDALLPQEGRVGLITLGRTTARFDTLHLLDLVSNRPLSGPAAY